MAHIRYLLRRHSHLIVCPTAVPKRLSEPKKSMSIFCSLEVTACFTSASLVNLYLDMPSFRRTDGNHWARDRGCSERDPQPFSRSTLTGW